MWNISATLPGLKAPKENVHTMHLYSIRSTLLIPYNTLIPTWIRFISFTAKNTHNDKVKKVCLKFLQIYEIKKMTLLFPHLSNGPTIDWSLPVLNSVDWFGRAHSRQGMSELQGIVYKFPRQDCIAPQIWKYLWTFSVLCILKCSNDSTLLSVCMLNVTRY